MLSRRLIGVCAAIVVATAACSGGGSSSSSALPPTPAPSTGPFGNAYTSYSIYQGMLNNESVIDVTPLGTKSSIPGATAVAGSVIYPDGSVQVADAAGNFDASQSVWALLNGAMLQVDPSSGPIVDVVYSPASGTAPLPEELSLVAYDPGGPRVPLAMTEAGTVPELATVNVAPKSAWLADGRSRIYTAYGRDQNGGSLPLNKSSVVWSVKRSATCGSPAGTIAALPSDASRAIYTAPKTGSSSANCPDMIVASVAVTGATLSGSGAAFSFDPAASPKLAGVLNDQSGKPVAKAVIDLYGAGADAAQGSLLVTTDANGKFARTVPAARIITPVVLTISGTKASQNSISPASVNPATAGAALANQTWKLVAPTVVVKPPSPNYQQAIKDAANYSAEMRESLPTDVPAANGTFAAGSLEAILAAPRANATGMVATGEFRKYTYAWDSTGKIATFTQPGPAAEAIVETITINASKVGGNACPAGAACYSFVQKRSATLLEDGAWSQAVASGKYSLTYVANQYSSSHQTLGSPLYVDTTVASQTLGATGALSLTQTHATASGITLAVTTSTHTPGSGTVVYTYSGTVKAYPGGAKTSEVDYTLSNGAVNEDGSGGFKFLTTASPVSADKNVQTTWTINAPATATTSGKRVTGLVDLNSLSNLASGHAGSFSIDQHNVVTLTLDSSLGGGTSSFPL